MTARCLGPAGSPRSWSSTARWPATRRPESALERVKGWLDDGSRLTCRRSPRRSARRASRSGSAVCTAAGCLSSGSRGRQARAWRRPSQQAGLGDRVAGLRGRLPAALLRGAAGPGRPRRPALREGDAGRGRRRSSRALDGGTATAPAGRPGPTRSSPARWPIVLENSGAGRARADRVVHRGRRLPGALPGPARDDPGGGRRGDHPQRPARPRRGGLPDRAEVGHGRQAAGRAEVRRLQRRRGRPRRLHGPQRAGERPAPRPRGHGHRRLRRRGRARASSTSAASTRWRSAGWRRRSSRPSGSACWAARSSSRRSTSRSTSASAPGRSSAARRRR